MLCGVFMELYPNVSLFIRFILKHKTDPKKLFLNMCKWLVFENYSEFAGLKLLGESNNLSISNVEVWI